jgi:hypothetical protein
VDLVGVVSLPADGFPCYKTRGPEYFDVLRLFESKRNGGKFPFGRVTGILVGFVDTPAHHTSNPMPIWGGVFDGSTNGARRRAKDRLEILTTYLESIQQH